ncbi:MAG: tRNA (N6-isopentenyl adenosine(37)-C2)-methylthiotransferase MiaB [Myxococcales bacterium]|nr:tRNA (N6-isopentenyl adenosine(37)-C2)-methylthiotransferase MiaB [Myxococcales bacterium]
MGRFAVITFGCQMNKHDSDRLESVLRGAGHEPTLQPAAADIVVLNTCSVREKAEHKLRSEVGRIARLKRHRPELVIVVAGCMAQHEGAALARAMPAIDVVIGPDNIADLPGLLAQAELGGPPLVRTAFDLDAPHFLAPSSSDGAARRACAYVTIMKGCAERCSFCIVPYTRGPERYRPSDDIVAEVAGLVAGGVREVTLLGQTVNSYADPMRALPQAPEHDPEDPGESELAALCRRIAAEVPGLARLRYTSPHPRHLSRSLVAAHRELTVLCRHLHLPVQSGSDRMLKRMIRRHDRAEYLRRVGALRHAVPGLTLSTDVIVGFSGETEEDFAATLSLVREVGFTSLFGFKYSPRPLTPALKMGDDVPEGVKEQRLAALFAVSEELAGAHLSGLVGSRQQVLVEGPSKSAPARHTGRTERNEIAHIEGASELELTGEIVAVEIVEAFKHSLGARLAPGERERLRPRNPAGSGTRPRRALPLLGASAGPG